MSERLRDPAHRVSPRARVLWLATGLSQVAIVAAALWGWAAITDDAHVVVCVIVGVLALAYLVGMPLWRYAVHRWEATPTAVYTQSGWVVRERRIAPLSRIQTVDLRRGPISQLLRLGSVTVTTASARGPLVIHGLELATAQQLLDDLTRAVEVEREDGT